MIIYNQTLNHSYHEEVPSGRNTYHVRIEHESSIRYSRVNIARWSNQLHRYAGWWNEAQA